MLWQRRTERDESDYWDGGQGKKKAAFTKEREPFPVILKATVTELVFLTGRRKFNRLHLIVFTESCGVIQTDVHLHTI